MIAELHSSSRSRRQLSYGSVKGDWLDGGVTEIVLGDPGGWYTAEAEPATITGASLHYALKRAALELQEAGEG